MLKRTRLLRHSRYLKLAIADILGYLIPVYLFAITTVDISHVFLSAACKIVTHGGSCPR